MFRTTGVDHDIIGAREPGRRKCDVVGFMTEEGDGENEVQYSGML